MPSWASKRAMKARSVSRYWVVGVAALLAGAVEGALRQMLGHVVGPGPLGEVVLGEDAVDELDEGVLLPDLAAAGEAKQGDPGPDGEHEAGEAGVGGVLHGVEERSRFGWPGCRRRGRSAA